MAKKKTDDTQIRFEGERIFHKNMEDCLHDSMIPYAKHVILDRALPRIEDGLKPVQRRILYTMMELSLTPDKPHRKSARIVGDCLGKYHPHGDSSVYDAMVRMSQSFVMRMPLVDGHGNFGSIDGDCAAALRYTEARMTPLALELLRDIDKETVRFELNFDDTLKEPVLLPGRFPNLIVNGANGIAVGLATSIPPHNLGEAIDACVAVMENPEITLDEVMNILPAPDFPTGGYLLNSPEIREAYETGRGKLTMRAKVHFEPQKNGKTLIVATELPFQLNKAVMLTKILETSQKKRDSLKAFAQITDIRDESDRNGLRAVIEIKKDADPEVVLAALYKHTDLQTTFGVNMVVIADGKPRQLGIIDMIKGYLRHQEDVVTRRTQFELDAARKREHILDGLVIAIINIDEVIRIIRASKTPKEAKLALMERFNYTELQAQAILDLRLQRLTNLELVAIQEEAKAIKEQIAELLTILGSKRKLMSVIKKEMNQIRDKYADARRTELITLNNVAEQLADEVVVKEAVPLDIEIYEDESGDVSIAKRPRSMPNPDDTEQKPIYAFETSSDKQLKLFTEKGTVLTLLADDLPMQQKAKGKMRPTRLVSLIPLEDGEKLVGALMCGKEDAESSELLFFTRQGMVKRGGEADYLTKKSRVTAITLKDGDALMSVMRTNPAEVESSTILLITARGMSIRFKTDTVPSMGRSGGGVKCIKPEIGDSVVFASTVGEMGELLVISDRGYAKRTFVFDYDVQGRNGKGLKTFDFKKNGSNGTKVVAAFYLVQPASVEVTQLHGMKTVINSDEVATERRASMGRACIISVLDDIIVSAKLVKEEE